MQAIHIIICLAGILLFNPQKTRAQAPVVQVKGKIVDINGSPLSNVIVQIGEHKTSTDSQGLFGLNAGNGEHVLICKLISYSTVRKRVIISNDNRFMRLTMLVDIKALGGLEVNAEFNQEIQSANRAVIIDYGFISDHIVTVNKIKGDYYLRIIGDKDSILSENHIDLQPKLCFKDCFDHLHVVGKENTLQLDLNGKNLTYLNSTTDEFKKLILPCVVSSESTLYFKMYSANNQAVQIISYNRSNGEKSTLYDCIDTEGHARAMKYKEVISEIPYINPMAELSIAELSIARKKMQNQWLYDMALTLPIPLPVFKQHDSVYIFDPQIGEMSVFDINNQRIRQTQINYHTHRNLTPNLIQDELTKEVYISLASGFSNQILKINMITGKISLAAMALKHLHAENIKINNGWVYYMLPNIDGKPYKRLIRQKMSF